MNDDGTDDGVEAPLDPPEIDHVLMMTSEKIHKEYLPSSSRPTLTSTAAAIFLIINALTMRPKKSAPLAGIHWFAPMPVWDKWHKHIAAIAVFLTKRQLCITHNPVISGFQRSSG